MEISSKEVLRYLGYRDVAANERVSSLTGELIDLFSAKVVPRNVYGVWDCKSDSSTVSLGSMNAESKNLSKHLTDCRYAVLLAATLGPDADTLIRRFTVQDMEKAVIAQAVCAAMIEAYCDSIESEILQKPEFNGLYFTSRFSPGYGDFNITHQKDILRMLNSTRIGVSLTDGYMLVPSKSVTAVIGFSRIEKRVAVKCEYCAKKNCKAREAV
jgi:cobalamin-dependent methionine synthase I